MATPNPDADAGVISSLQAEIERLRRDVDTLKTDRNLDNAVQTVRTIAESVNFQLGEQNKRMLEFTEQLERFETKVDGRLGNMNERLERLDTRTDARIQNLAASLDAKIEQFRRDVEGKINTQTAVMLSAIGALGVLITLLQVFLR